MKCTKPTDSRRKRLILGVNIVDKLMNFLGVLLSGPIERLAVVYAIDVATPHNKH